MKICGLQKTTLLDYPGRLACTVFLAGCNMRCPFCHNYELTTGKVEPAMTAEEVLNFLNSRKGKLEGVVISGGEPTLNDELIPFMREIKALGFGVKLDTNGTRPEILHRIIVTRLVDYIAMDVKNSADMYAQTVGIPGFDVTPIKESIWILKAGRVEYEFRTTVVEQLHSVESMRGVGELIRGAEQYYLQPFVDRDTVPYGDFKAPSEATMKRYAKIVVEDVNRVLIRGLH